MRPVSGDGRIAAALVNPGRSQTSSDQKLSTPTAKIRPGATSTEILTQQSYGAHFAEVGVDIDTGEVRLRRMLGVLRRPYPEREDGAISGDRRHDLWHRRGPRRSDDPRSALRLLREPRSRRISRSGPRRCAKCGRDFFFPNWTPDPILLKSKGVSELGICGAGASIANAIYNACGVRVRDYPITLDKLISELPTQA